jgi:Fe-S-cluster containining protein
MKKKVEVDWRFKLGRVCGDCYACCVYLGIDELKKHAGRACRHLTGQNGPSQRCSIYPDRPKACQEYECAWRSGWGQDHWKPNKCGLLATFYPSEHIPNSLSCTIWVISKASEDDIEQATAHALALAREVVVINWNSKKGIYYRDGEIWACQAVRQDSFEDLTFRTVGDKLGRYETQDGQQIDLRNLPLKGGDASGA